MRTSYGVVWRAGEGRLARGKLQLLRSGLRLDGLSGSEAVTLDVPYREVAGVRIGRTAPERLNGRPTLLLDLVAGGRIVVSSVALPGALAELAERLSRSAARP